MPSFSDVDSSPRAEALGVDLSHTALRRAKAACGSVVRGDGSRLPFPAGVFDGCRMERVSPATRRWVLRPRTCCAVEAAWSTTS